MADHLPISEGLEPTWSGIPVERHESIWSTSGEALDRAHRGSLSGARVIVAATQTGAYGRRGRAWQAPRGGLWWTLAHPWKAETPASEPPHGSEALGLRVGWACLGLVSGELERAGVARERVRLKWPNDVLVDGRKALGCLCEGVVEGPEGKAGRSWLIVGVGLNVNNDAAELGSDLRRAPTSLRGVAGREFDLDSLGADLTARVLQALAPMGRDRWMGELGEIVSRLEGLDGPITLRLPGGETLRGTLVGLSDTGRLVVVNERGRTVAPAGAEIVASTSAGAADSRNADPGSELGV